MYTKTWFWAGLGSEPLVQVQSMEKLKWGFDQTSFDRDRAYGFSWPQRNYRCSFCKKEFKSAQALGGHMNVHRRDRARMRLSSPSSGSWDFPYPPNPNYSNPNQKPNPIQNPNPRAVLFSGSLLGKNVSSGVECGDFIRGKKSKGDKFGLGDARVWKAKEIVELDLSLGLIDDVKEDLDLELRLGYSS
ncbi:zinc finger protein 11 [Striga asiatica]|uniref:Zinc finger protein 11 n=1 Tax=Striga asiatica TaxID=4170 RepID=A0A5A7NWM7_STRAF|nr:zinc finger protein 11 [Striga asiatica]